MRRSSTLNQLLWYLQWLLKMGSLQK